MLSCLNDSAGSRLVEAGFNPADAGVKLLKEFNDGGL
jgi:hypothetical protein